MNKKEYDILQSAKELKKTPFTIPEGYFDTLKAEARKCTEPQYVHVSWRARLAPYAAIAAMFLFIFVLCKVFIQTTPGKAANTEQSPAGQSIYEDYLVFNDMDTDISAYYLEDDNTAESALSEEDIMEYLIYIGATEEYIEYTNE
jgi:hypothetical protein